MPAAQPGRADLLASIQGKGVHSLRKVAPAETTTSPVEESTAGGAGDLAVALAAALMERNKRVGDSDEEDERPSSDDAPFSALAFKIMNDPFVGSLTFTRIYSGKLAKGQVLNSVKDKKEKIGRMLLMHSNNREDIDEAFAGVDVIVNALPDGADKETKQAAIRAAARSSAKVYFLDEFGS